MGNGVKMIVSSVVAHLVVVDHHLHTYQGAELSGVLKYMQRRASNWSRVVFLLSAAIILLSHRSFGVKDSFWDGQIITSEQHSGLLLGRATTISMAIGGETQQATFAAGCFWSVELAFQRVPGVVKTAVGYTQGRTENPTYEQVCSGRTGHAEAVLVDYNPSEATYEQILDVFWKKHDPTQKNRQGNDVGSQYRSGIYYHTPEQEAVAKASVKSMEEKLGKKIATEVLPAKAFYVAEEYHQQYLEKGVGGRGKQSARKMCNDPIRCYG